MVRRRSSTGRRSGITVKVLEKRGLVGRLQVGRPGSVEGNYEG